MRLSALVWDWKRWWRSAMLAGVLGTGIRAGANLMLIPLVVVKLTTSEQALWWVFVALGAFGNLADFGFGSTIPRIYSYLLAGADDFEAEGLREAKGSGAPNFDGIRRVNATVRSLYLKLSLAAVGLLMIGGTFYLMRPIGESGLGGKVWWLWAAFVAAIGYNLATSHWALAVQGLNRMRDLQMTYVTSSLTYVLCAAILLLCNMGLASMVLATFARGVVQWVACRKVYREAVPRSEQTALADPHILRKLWPNAYKFGVLSIGGFCLASGNVLISGQLLGKEITASFGLTAQVGTFVANFATLWLVVKWPEIAMLRTQGRLEEMARLFARRLTLVMASFAALGLMVFFTGNALLAWKGTHTRMLAQPYLAFYLLYLMQGVFYVQFGMLAFTENVVPFFKIGLYTGLGVIGCSLILTPLFGLWGLVVAPLIAETVCSNWYTVRRGFQGQPLSVRQFCRAMCFR